MHFGVVLGDLAALETGPDHEGVHRPFDVVRQDTRETYSAGTLPVSWRHLLLHHGLLVLVLVVLVMMMSHQEAWRRLHN